MRSLLLASGLMALACVEEGPVPEGSTEVLTEPLFAVVVRLQGEGGSAVVLLENPLTPTDLDLSNALPLPGNGAVFGHPLEPSTLFVFSGDTGVLTRFRIRGDRTFAADGEMAFTQLQTSLRFFSSNHFTILSSTEAYLFDPVAGELRLWDPDAMVLRGRIVLARDLVPGPLLFPVVGFDQHVVGDELFTTVAFANSIEDVADRTSLVTVTDIKRGELSEIVAINTCGYVRHSWLTAEGDLLFGTDAFSTAVGVASEGQRSGPSCIMAFDPVTKVQRSTPVLAAEQVFDGAPVGNFIFVSDNQAWARVLDPSLLPQAALTTVEITGGPYWRWGFIDGFDDPTWTILDDRPVGTSFADPFDIGDVRYAVENAPNFEGSQLLRLNRDGTLTPGVRTDQTIRGLLPVGVPVP
ncbi:MAG: hypothetical protein AAGA48_03650 [Myxococcota bacterium]